MNIRTLAALAVILLVASEAHAIEPLDKYNLCSHTRQTRILPADPALLAAVKAGQTTQVAAALAAGASPDGTDAEGFSLLDLAITEHQDRVLAQLLKAGADVNQPFMGSSPLALARDSTGATDSGKPSAVDVARRNLLEKAGAKFSDFDVAFGEMVRWRTGSIGNALIATFKDVDTVRLATLLRATYDVNEPIAEGMTMLHMAAMEGSPEAVSFLIGCGANVNALSTKGTPVMWFAKDRPEVMRVLEAAGATSTGITEAAIHKYYDEHPNLFANRKIYSLQLVTLQGPTDRRAEVVERAEHAHNGVEFTDWLTSQGFNFSLAPSTLGAEGVPLTIVDRLATLSPGESVAAPEANGGKIYTLVSTRSDPVSYEKVRAVIERYLAVDAAKHPTKYVRPA